MLEVRVHDIRFRAPYGVNSTSPGADIPSPISCRGRGPTSTTWISSAMSRSSRRVRSSCRSRRSWADGRRAARSAGAFGASPPTSAHGGNFDLQELSRGGTLFLPVNVPGALFFTGNGHALQGNGEITEPVARGEPDGLLRVHRAQEDGTQDAAHGNAHPLCVRRHPRFAR